MRAVINPVRLHLDRAPPSAVNTCGTPANISDGWRERPRCRRMPGNLATLLWILVLACAQASNASDLRQREPSLGLLSVRILRLLFTHVGRGLCVAAVAVTAVVLSDS